MKAPISNIAKSLLSNRDSSKKLMNRIIAGERDGNQSITYNDKTYSIQRVIN